MRDDPNTLAKIPFMRVEILFLTWKHERVQLKQGREMQAGTPGERALSSGAEASHADMSAILPHMFLHQGVSSSKAPHI